LVKLFAFQELLLLLLRPILELELLFGNVKTVDMKKLKKYNLDYQKPWLQLCVTTHLNLAQTKKDAASTHIKWKPTNVNS